MFNNRIFNDTIELSWNITLSHLLIVHNTEHEVTREAAILVHAENSVQGGTLQIFVIGFSAVVLLREGTLPLVYWGTATLPRKGICTCG